MTLQGKWGLRQTVLNLFAIPMRPSNGDGMWGVGQSWNTDERS